MTSQSLKDSVREQGKLREIARRALDPSLLAKIISLDMTELERAVFQQNYSQKFPHFDKIDSSFEIVLPKDNYELGDNENLDGWIFGYGSLIWKADFPYESRLPGFIKGFDRFFYQNSIDHRGTPENPGRVVTLVPSTDPNSTVWGVGYRIAELNKDNVMAHLDFREKNGYERHIVQFYPYINKSASDQSIEMITYIATSSNDSYAGHISELDAIVEQIYSARGPSGPNIEYVYKLANAMRALFPGEEDSHLFELEQKLRTKEANDARIIDYVRREISRIIHEAMMTSQIPDEIAEDLKNIDERMPVE